MASFVEAVCGATKTALAADATLLGYLGAATQIRRAFQRGETEPPCVIMEPGDEEPPVEAADELRTCELTLHCYATNDLTAATIRDRVIALLNHNISLTATGYKIDMSFVRRASRPFWSDQEQAFRCEVWIALNMKSTG